MDEKTKGKIDPENPPKSRKPRKRVSRRKKINRPKVRGKHKSDPSKLIGLGDFDLAECIFPDTETRAEFLEDLSAQPDAVDVFEEDSQPLGEGLDHTYALSPSDVPSPSLSVACSSASLHGQHDSECSVESLRESAASESRPSSSLEVHSRPESAASTSRPSSSVGSKYRSGSATSESRPSTSIATPSPPPTVCSPPPTEEKDVPFQSTPTNDVLEDTVLKLKSVLPNCWIPICGRSGCHLLMLSQKSPKAIQREVFMPYSGDREEINIHCKPLSFSEDFLKSLGTGSVKLEMSTVDLFCKRGESVVKALMRYKICAGAEHVESKAVWGNIPNVYVDKNPYQEASYVETCRSHSCIQLIELGKQLRCDFCAKVVKTLRERHKFLLQESASSSTPNIFLTHQQAKEKLRQQHEDIRKKDKKIQYLTKRMQDMLADEGVDIDEGVSSDLSTILSEADLSPVQKMFLEEQIKCSQKADARAHRWHPSMIRLALYLKMVSSSAYEALRDSGAVKLPSSRTLFDYSHAFAPQEGISDGLLKMVAEKVSKMKNDHQKFVSLLCDEMHVSKNLVYREEDGHLVGYIHLDEVDKEMIQFEKFINGEDTSAGAPIANKILAFMVKGITSDVKCLIASYPCSQLTKDMLYARTWNVISRLERAGVKVLAMVSDGSTVNRAFINMHTPLTTTESGIIFDTLNICSPEGRPLFFIADVCHLLKTIRNCFYNSGEGEKKTRCLELNGEKILWKTIIRLYLTYKQSNFRKSYKLNAQNVFPNSYSCMKVRFAAVVLSKTVATDITEQNWANTEETARFIRKVNKFFDCLNGAHSDQYVRSKNENLAPYTQEDDPRFKRLLKFLKYLEDWKKQVEAMNISPTEKAKKMLSRQTLDGIEIAIRGFIGATRLILLEGANFVMARAFSQDPLEQQFSKHRASGGGSRNPNVSQFLSQQVSIGMQRELGVRRRKGNVEAGKSGMEVTTEPLPKRQRTSSSKRKPH